MQERSAGHRHWRTIRSTPIIGKALYDDGGENDDDGGDDDVDGDDDDGYDGVIDMNPNCKGQFALVS